MPQSFDSTVTLSASGTYSLIPVGVPYGRDGYLLRVTGSGWTGSLVLVENHAPPGSAANYVNVAYQNADTLLQVAAGTAITGDGTFIVPVRGYDVAVQYTHTAGSVTLSVSPAHGINRDEAEDVGFARLGGGTFERTAQDKLAEQPSVTDFGAVGDGVTDDYAALARAATALGATNRLYFPPGTYRVGTNLTVNCEAIFALGATLEPDSGVTVTLAGPVTTAPGASIIASGAAGTVSITGPVGAAATEVAVETFGAVGDGVTDDTAAINRAISAVSTAGGGVVVCQAKTYGVGVINLQDNVTLVLKPGCTLLDLGNLGANDRTLNIVDVENVRVIGYGAVIDQQGAYVSGEQRHGVNIRGGVNVVVEGLECRETGGDGFYVGFGTATSANVILRDCIGDANRRQGLSIVSADGLLVERGLFKNTAGTNPQAGIDIEPNNTADVLNNIVLRDVVCEDNANEGLLIFLGSWQDTTLECSIRVENIVTRGNLYGVQIVRCPDADPPNGSIVIDGHVSENELGTGFRVTDWDVNGPSILAQDVYVINPNRGNQSLVYQRSGIALYNTGTYTATPGNVRLVRPVIRDPLGGIPASTAALQLTVADSGAWQDVVAEYPDVSGGDPANPWAVNGSSEGSVRIIVDLPDTVSPAPATLSSGRYFGRIIQNDGASGQRTFTLPAATAARVGWEFRFQVTVAQELRVDPDGTDIIGPGGTAGQYITANVIGSYLQLRCLSAGYWSIVQISGTWTFV